MKYLLLIVALGFVMADLSIPGGVAYDKNGTLYIAEWGINIVPDGDSLRHTN